MDDLEFRRTVMAEPNSKDSRVQQAAKSDSSKQAFLDEMRQFDDTIGAALQVDVPENLSERLILRQALESHNQDRRRTYSYIAIAASIAFTFGLSFQFLSLPFGLPDNVNQNLGTHSLNHLAHETGYLDSANEINTLAQVNSKLARFGGQVKPQLANHLGEPVFVNYCDFAGVTSLHLIYQTSAGRMSVFVAPSDSKIPFASDFSDDNFIGKGLAFSKAHISVLGKDKQAVQDFSQKIERSIEWSI